MKIVAIIPARKNSKGLPNKNILPFCGKELITWTINAAISANVFEKVIVSTDCNQIANIAKSYNAEIPYLRSNKLAQDNVLIKDVLLDILDYYNKNEVYFDAICLLQPTSPLRNSLHIKEAIHDFKIDTSVSIVSVTKIKERPEWMKIKGLNNKIYSYLKDENKALPRQSHHELYKLNGAIYCISTKEFLKTESLHQEGSNAYFMNETASIDIDDQMDFDIAEYLYSRTSK